MKRLQMIVGLAALMALTITGCKEKTTAEKVEDSVKQAASDTKGALEDAGKDLKKVGEDVKDGTKKAYEETKEAVKEGVEKVKEAVKQRATFSPLPRWPPMTTAPIRCWR